MPTAYLSPSRLRELTDVSATAPDSGDNGKALVWNNTAGKWQAEQVAYTNLSGAPALPIPVVSGGTGTQTGSITGTGALAFTAAANSNLSLNFSGTGNFLLNQGATNRFGIKSNGIIHFFGEPIDDINLPFQIRAANNIGYFSVNDGSDYGLLAGYDNGPFGWGGAVFRNVRTTSGSQGEWITFAVRNVSIALRIFGDRSAQFYSTASSTSTTTGAVIVDGGVGIAENLHVGGTINGLGAVQPGTPASPTAAGTQWQVRVDENYIYVCTQTGTGTEQDPAAWKRVAISTWTP